MSMKKKQHECIKPECTNSYWSTEEEAYYCESCDAKRLEIAKQIDKRHSTVGAEPPMTPLQEYDNAPKVHGRFMQVH